VSMPQRQRAEYRRKARTGDELPQQRLDVDDRPTSPVDVTETGGSALVAHTLSTSNSVPDSRETPATAPTLPTWLDNVTSSKLARGIVADVLAVLAAAADVWAYWPEKAHTYQVVLSGVSCAALLLRRKLPFLAVLLTVPGYLVGWSTVAAIIALATLAKRRQLHWVTWVGAALIWGARFIAWPLDKFFAHTWRDHISWGIYAVIFTGMPLAVGLLISVRQELTTRIAQLAATRRREIKLREETVRSAERARLAREMHDVVSHQVTLIAMQAGALQVSAHDETSRQAARTIRELSTRTLEELRGLVGVLRSGIEEDDAQPGLDELGALARDFDIKVTVAMEALPDQLPAPVSRAAYRTVQEALTNVRKHAVGAGASVRVVRQQDSLFVEVRNDRPDTISAGLPSGGHGLVGLRERTGLLGGTFHAGPTPEGGFRVEATYPLELAN
jgi:signal transduction histidine kinase